MKLREHPRFVVLAVGSLLMAACSDSEHAASSAVGASDPAGGGIVGPGGSVAGPDGSIAGPGGSIDGDEEAASGYTVELVANPAGLHVGKSRFQLKIATKSDGKAATGLASSIALAPLMTMSMMSHGAPVPIDAVHESATPGTYDCALFFPMASVDASGNPAGQWTVKVRIGALEAGSVPLTVTPGPAGSDTTHVMLRNAADTITTHGAAKMRSYPLFRDALEATTGGHTFKVFVATIQEGMMVWPPVSVGLKLVDQSGAVQLTVQSLDLQASTDGTTWSPMTCDAASRCAARIEGLSSGTPGKIYVKMALNGHDYTTDGAAPDAGKKNAFATFMVTPP